MSTKRARVVLGVVAVLSLSALVWLSVKRDERQEPTVAARTDPDSGGALVVAEATFDPSAARSPAVLSVSEGASKEQASDPWVTIQEELASQVNDSLDGFLYINHVLDQLTSFAQLPVETKADLDYESDERACFKLQETPPGTTARLLVLHKPFELEGRELRGIELEVQMDAEEPPGFYRDCFRSGPRAHISISYDEAGDPVGLALILERKINPKVSRENGIDAYQGRFTCGAGYRVDLSTGTTTSETFGFVNGNYAFRDAFQGISPLRGDVQIDKERVGALLRELTAKRRQVDSSSD